MKLELLKAIYSAARQLNKASVEQISGVLRGVPSEHAGSGDSAACYRTAQSSGNKEFNS